MAETKYIITVDSATDIPTKLERIGASGELIPIQLSNVPFKFGDLSSAGAATTTGAAALTDGSNISLLFPPNRPPGRAR